MCLEQSSVRLTVLSGLKEDRIFPLFFAERRLIELTD